MKMKFAVCQKSISAGNLKAKCVGIQILQTHPFLHTFKKRRKNKKQNLMQTAVSIIISVADVSNHAFLCSSDKIHELPDSCLVGLNQLNDLNQSLHEREVF